MDKKTNYSIEVENLWVEYETMQSFSIKQQFGKKWLGKRERFQAIKGVSFRVPEGAIVGLVGKNGSGKSTLLKTLAGIFSPDEGKIDIHGKTISLLALGVGFQNELSGKENIMLSGLLLGFSREKIEMKMQEIIDFADLGEFIDKPIKTYSSGMSSKLAFAITSILETDIMLVDEVLSVGDASFKKKSFAKMKKLIKDKQRTVIIVSHNIDTLKKLCDSIIWMHEGKVKMYDEADCVIKEYLDFMK